MFFFTIVDCYRCTHRHTSFDRAVECGSQRSKRMKRSADVRVWFDDEDGSRHVATMSRNGTIYMTSDASILERCSITT